MLKTTKHISLDIVKINPDKKEGLYTVKSKDISKFYISQQIIDEDFTKSYEQAKSLRRESDKEEIATKESSKNEDSTSSSDKNKTKDTIQDYYKQNFEDQQIEEVSITRRNIEESSEEEDDFTFTHSIMPEDLKAIRKIGSGTFANVYLCKSKKTGEKFALKVIDKKKLKTKNLVRYAITEKQILLNVKSGFIVSLKLSFQTKSHCYLLMDYCPGGDIWTYLDEESSFDEDKARFYLWEIIAAIHALHMKGIIHRDLKPNNIMLDKEGHIKLIDFNLWKTGIVTSLQRTKSFWGTPAYMPPEMLSSQRYGKTLDWYLVGVILYEMIVGIPPFFEANITKVRKNILTGTLKFPTQCSDECKDLLRRLLWRLVKSLISKLLIYFFLLCYFRDPSRRLGNKNSFTKETGAKDILSHPWFKGVTLEEIESKLLVPNKPYLMKQEKDFLCSISEKEKRHIKAFNSNLKGQLKVNILLTILYFTN